MLFKETVSPGLLNLLKRLMKVDEFKAFRLVGGTALALQLGHRESVDIDLFSYREFPKEILRDSLMKNFSNLTKFEIGEISLSFYLENTKVDFLEFTLYDGVTVILKC